MKLWRVVLAVGAGCLVFGGAGRVLAADEVVAPTDPAAGEDKPLPYVEIPLDDRRARTAASPATLPPESPEIDALVGQLGDGDFRRREAAAARLREMGPAALPALGRARASSGDPELVSRADAILREAQNPPPGRRLPRGSGLGGALTLKQTKRDGLHEVEVLEQNGRVVRIRSTPAGITMSVTGDDGKGKTVTRDFQAASADELRRQNPEAHALYQRWTGQRGAVDPAGPPGNLLWRGRPGNVPGNFGGNARGLNNDELDMLRRQRAMARAELDRARAMADAQQREMPGMLDQLRRQQQPGLQDGLGGVALLPPGVRLDVSIISAPGDDAAGARVATVLPGGRADRLGVKPADVITSVNGRRVTGADTLLRALADAQPPLVVEATRDGKTMTFEEKKPEQQK